MPFLFVSHMLIDKHHTVLKLSPLSSLHYYPTYQYILIRKDITLPAAICYLCVALLLYVCVGSVLISLCISGGVSIIKEFPTMKK